MSAAPLSRVLVIVAGLIALALPAAAADRPIEDFFGEYEGQSASTADGAEIKPRQLNVAIQKSDGGFTVAWSTITTRASGKAKAKAYTVTFVPTDRPGVFAAGMRRNAAGKLEPLDPMSGEPYVWATLEGDTLTVHALLIDERGTYEVQTYARSLTADGMELRFRRTRDGDPVREVNGTLRRIGS